MEQCDTLPIIWRHLLFPSHHRAPVHVMTFVLSDAHSYIPLYKMLLLRIVYSLKTFENSPFEVLTPPLFILFSWKWFVEKQKKVVVRKMA